LIELLSHNLDYFRAKPVNIPKITILLDHGYHPDKITAELQKLYPQIMTKIRFELAPKPTLAEKAAVGKTGFVPVATRWVIERSNAWMERCKSLVKNFERTLSHATAKLNLCFIRLMLKRLANDRSQMGSIQPTVAIIDEYCAEYKDLFKEVRNYECLKYLHLGIISLIKRKSLPEIAKVVSINSAQSLHHFLAYSDWSVKKLKSRRLNKLKKALKGKAITVVIDETGDRKKGKKTDYVARQYLGSVGKIDNGIVSVNAYGVYDNITFPLSVKVSKN
jgi:hypothetical protein